MCTDILLGFIFKEPVHECYIEVVFVGSLFASLLISGLWRLNRIDPKTKTCGTPYFTDCLEE